MIRLAWRLLRRELRSGELRLLFASLVVAVAAVSAVGFFADRVRQALDRQAQQMMGGDLVVSAEHPLAEAYAGEARRQGLRVAEAWLFPSMVFSGAQPQLAEIKAVSGDYPLRGELGVAPAAQQPVQSMQRGPTKGSAWPDERLASALNLQPGQTLGLGMARLEAGGILTQEPDRGVNFFNLAPRLMMHLDDLPASGLIQPGSRIRYRLMVAGEGRAVEAYKRWLTPRLAGGERIEDIQNARPEVRNILDRAQRFLGLATLLTVILAAVAAALSARRYLQRHLDACAVMRCLGATQGELLRLHALLFVWLAALAALLGSLLGYAAHFVLAEWLLRLFTIQLPPPGIAALYPALAIGLVLLFGFAFPPLLQLARVPTLRVLRREMGPANRWQIIGYLLGLLLLAGLIVIVAGNAKLGGIAVGGFVIALGAFWLVARAIVLLLARMRGVVGFGWRQGLASLAKHGASSTLQIVALAIGLMAMILLTVTRAELLDAWQQTVPVDAPNRFVINIQPEQRDGVADFLQRAGVEAELSPMIRGRLTQIAGKPVSAASYPEDERAQRLVEREFNLSWRASVPPGNRVVAGAWSGEEARGQGVASVEEGLAKTLGIRLGDELVFSVAGREQTMKVGSLRKLDWDSMRVNFFVLTPPGVLDDANASYITSFHLNADDKTTLPELLKRYPNLTVIDIGAMLGQLQNIIGQVSAAIQFVFLFTLLAGALVLQAALLSAFDERRYELAVMRALGALRGQLRRAMAVELAVIGACAGLIAALAAAAVGWVIATRAFDLSLHFDPWPILLAPLAGAALTLLVGWMLARRLLATPPLEALRSGA